LSRGHLSRPACSHVKQIAKRPGTRVPGRDLSPAGFLLASAWPRKVGTGFRPRPCARPKRPKEGHMPASNQKTYRPETRLVHAGTLRSQYGETSEALFLTQGYVYPSAEECEARFSGKIPGYVYSRYSNPTMDMFEQRMAALEGAE